ncbi:hypothetical protein ACN28E_24145 [Archangium lansingense]|uniref:hypothetical protein n=1 Tax=Archangium lansingense TaxID=2995310 RepID=UPI003B79D4F8
MGEQGGARPVELDKDGQSLGRRGDLDGQARDSQPCQLPLRLWRKSTPIGGGDERGERMDILLPLFEALAQVQHHGMYVEWMRGGELRAKCIQRGSCLEQEAREVHEAHLTARLRGWEVVVGWRMGPNRG